MGELGAQFRRIRFLAGLVLIHFALAVAVGLATGIPFNPGTVQILGMLLTILVPIFLVVLMLRHFLWLALVVRPARPIGRFAADLRGVVTDLPRMLGGIVALLLICLFVGAFSYFKALIAHFNPFEWDQAFAAADRMLHGGVDPFRLLWPVTGSPLATTVLNGFYHGWFFLLYFMVFLACFLRDPDRHGMRFLVALVLTLALGGNLIATWLSSAGPVYYGRLGLGADYAALMDSLRSFAKLSPVWALDVQEGLWAGHVADGPLSGISAMPSMHVASSALMAIYGYRLARWAGHLLAVFALLIMVGSIHLGWHYAIDGYAGAALAWLAWRVAGALVGRRDRSAAENPSQPIEV